MVAFRGDHYYKLNIMAESKGLGDTIEKFTKTTGVKNLVDFVIETVVVRKIVVVIKEKRSLTKSFLTKNK